ncbi:MAG: hypothetical protein NT007_19100 [Candidatus Kapabacteria bacterium]|nr:hypothetical protein [Candidatus Kapabacteria bacterium]
MIEKFKTKISQKSIIIYLIIVASLVIATAGFFFYRYEENIIRQEKYGELKAIADLKAKQIEDWIIDKKKDVNLVIKSPFF